MPLWFKIKFNISSIFPNCAGMFSLFCADILLPTVMGCITHSCGSYDSQLWVVQPITVGSKTSAHDWKNICWETGKHLRTNQQTGTCGRIGKGMECKHFVACLGTSLSRTRVFLTSKRGFSFIEKKRRGSSNFDLKPVESLYFCPVKKGSRRNAGIFIA